MWFGVLGWMEKGGFVGFLGLLYELAWYGWIWISIHSFIHSSIHSRTNEWGITIEAIIKRWG